jgi:hypothetical protein
MMKERSRTILLCALSATTIFLFQASRCDAQITDIFGTAFKSIKGFSLSLSHPFYLSMSNADQGKNIISLEHLQGAFSVRFDPLLYGAHVDDSAITTTIAIDVHSEGAKPDFFCVTTFDTLVRQSGENLYHAHSLTRSSSDTACPKSTSVITTVTVPTKLENSVLFSLGYAHTPSYKFTTSDGFNADFPYGGVFLLAIARPFSRSVPHFLFGLGGAFYTLNGVHAIYKDTTVLKMSSSTIFAPEVIFGYSFSVSRNMSVIADIGYQIVRFRGLDYEVSGGLANLKDIYALLPKVIDASAARIRLGFSFDVF